MKKLRVGIVGSGIGRSHAEAYTNLPEMYEVVALCDISAERRDKVADMFAIPERPDSMSALYGMGLDAGERLHQCAGFHVHEVHAATFDTAGAEQIAVGDAECQNA